MTQPSASGHLAEKHPTGFMRTNPRIQATAGRNPQAGRIDAFRIMQSIHRQWMPDVEPSVRPTSVEGLGG